MKATLNLNNAIVYNIQELMVLKDQQFKLKLTIEGEVPEVFKWFSDNDQVLDLRVYNDGLRIKDGMEAEVKAGEPGVSTILIMNNDMVVVKRLVITVVDQLPVEADVLEVSTEVLPK